MRTRTLHLRWIPFLAVFGLLSATLTWHEDPVSPQSMTTQVEKNEPAVVKERAVPVVAGASGEAPTSTTPAPIEPDSSPATPHPASAEAEERFENNDEPGDDGHSHSDDDGHGHGQGDDDADVIAELPPTSLTPFSLLGVTWDSGVSASAEVQVRWRSTTTGEWSSWTDVHGEPTTEGRQGTEPQWVDSANGAAVRVIDPSGTSTPVGLSLATVDPGSTPSIAPAAATVGQPPIVLRSFWGAKSSSGCGDVYGRTTSGAVVHHTVGSNTYTKAQSAGIVKATQAYHMQGRDWCDIGYNFLVDKYGQIFEGRAGGITRPVRAAHAGNYAVNQQTMGVSMMGTFTDTAPSADMKASVAKLIAWRLSRYGRPATGTYRLGGITLNRISGHRDVVSTECPGIVAYRWVTSDLRTEVAKIMATGSGSSTGGQTAQPFKFTAPKSMTVDTVERTRTRVTWNPIKGAEQYVVMVSRQADMKDGRWIRTSTNAATVTGLTPGVLYYFKVKARDPKTLKALSPYSSVVSARSWLYDAPASLTVTDKSNSRTSLTWPAQSGAKQYIVMVSRQADMKDGRWIRASSNKATVTGLTPGVLYYYKVKVRDPNTTAALSPYGKPVSERTYQFATPTALKLTSRTATSNTIAWTGDAKAPAFTVMVSRQPDMKDGRWIRTTSRSFKVTRLSPGVAYYYKVRSADPNRGYAQISSYSSILKVAGATASATSGSNATNSVSVPSGGSVTIKGRGFGHGHGMSQYGAQFAASKGRGAGDILQRYYPGTSIGTVNRTMRVLITADTTAAVTVRARSGLQLRANYQTRSLPTRNSRGTIRVWEIYPMGSTSILKYKVGSRWYRSTGTPAWTGDAVFQASGGTMGLVLPDGSTRTFRGSLRSAVPYRGSSDRNTVNYLGLDDYVRGVVAAEMPASWEWEALRAQSIAARTYAINTSSPSRYYDICDTTACQVYRGVSAETSRTNRVVDSTRGKIVTYNGSAAFTQFSSSSGGYTDAGSVPYLKSIDDPWDDYAGNPSSSWSTSISASRVQSYYPKIGTLRSMKVTKRNGLGKMGGRVLSLQLIGSKSTVTITGDQARSAFGLRSNWFGF